MKELLKRFEEKEPEVVFEWNDSETEARGWAVINSLRGGAAGGGTRMRLGLDKHEVVSLAKTMEIKFSVSGPAIGGAKSGINFDPTDPRKPEVLKRWFNAVYPVLKNYYGTGGDLNVDEIHEVIPITESYGLWHPQEGIVNGHFKASEPEKIKALGQLRLGVSKILEDPKVLPDGGKVKLTVADLITGYGVSEAVRYFYDIYGGSIEGKKVIIQGWGNVGGAAALYLSKEGAIIIGIIDKAGGLINTSGFSLDQIKEIFHNREGNQLKSDDMLPFDLVNDAIWDAGADIFVPAAASRLVDMNQLERLVAGGLEVISCGANVPFKDKEIFYGSIAEFADKKVAVIPDFIANCGMARVFAYLMQGEVELTDEAIFSDTSNTIKLALQDTFKLNAGKTEISKTAYQIALSKIL